MNDVLVPMELIRDRQLSDGSKMVYIALCLLPEDKHQISDITGFLGKHYTSIMRNIHELEEKGWITRKLAFNKMGLNKRSYCSYDINLSRSV